jgi:gas vesicle protein GvpA/GvpJ/GvpM family
MPQITHSTDGANLADVLERILDKGVVIAGDIRIRLLEIELLTVNIRLLISSVDKAREIGIDWWSYNPFLSSAARTELPAASRAALESQMRDIQARLDELERSREAAPELRSPVQSYETVTNP